MGIIEASGFRAQSSSIPGGRGVVPYLWPPGVQKSILTRSSWIVAF